MLIMEISFIEYSQYRKAARMSMKIELIVIDRRFIATSKKSQKRLLRRWLT